MRLVLTRHGGLAAITRPPLVVETDDLSRAEAEPIEALARTVAARYRDEPHVGAENSNIRDQFGYSLAIGQGDESEVTVTFQHPSVPKDIKELVATLRVASAAGQE